MMDIDRSTLQRRQDRIAEEALRQSTKKIDDRLSRKRAGLTNKKQRFQPQPNLADQVMAQSDPMPQDSTPIDAEGPLGPVAFEFLAQIYDYRKIVGIDDRFRDAAQQLLWRGYLFQSRPDTCTITLAGRQEYERLIGLDQSPGLDDELVKKVDAEGLGAVDPDLDRIMRQLMTVRTLASQRLTELRYYRALAADRAAIIEDMRKRYQRDLELAGGSVEVIALRTEVQQLRELAETRGRRLKEMGCK